MSIRTEEQVAITGLGVVSAAGRGIWATWYAALLGKSLAARLEWQDGIDAVGCSVPEFDVSDVLSTKDTRRMHRFSSFAAIAAHDAVHDAHLDGVVPDRAGVIAGSALGGLAAGGGERLSPLAVPTTLPNAPAATVSIRLGWTGPNLSVSSGCASSAHAVTEACRLLRHGEADVMLAGGTDAALNPVVLTTLQRLGSLAATDGDPRLLCRPFSPMSRGCVVGEGSAFCVLERESDVRARGGTAYALVAGYARNSGGAGLGFAGQVDAVAAADCVLRALESAECEPEEIDAVFASASGGTVSDQAEEEALHKVFASVPPITAIKGTIGHTMGAAAAMNVAAASMGIRRRFLPPTANHDPATDGVGLDVVHGLPRDVNAVNVLVTAFAFGGQNVALVLRAAR